jgi:hypothetical protein
LARTDNSAAHGPSKFITRVDDNTQIRELVFRDLMRGAKPGAVFFLHLGENTDPSKEFLGRFRDLNVQVRKGSQSQFIEPRAGSGEPLYYDRTTREPGVLLYVSDLRRLDGGRVGVDGSYYAKALHAYGIEYTFERATTGWKMVRRRKSWVS